MGIGGDSADLLLEGGLGEGRTSEQKKSDQESHGRSIASPCGWSDSP